MEKAIISKEWIKTRLAVLVSAVLCLAMAGYVILKINRLVALKGVEHLWMIMLLKDNTFVDAVGFTTVLSAILIGIAQMAPEMIQKRLKLTLHLPYPQMRMTMLMLSVGLAEILMIYLVQCGVIALYYSALIPPSLVGRVVLTMLPWYFAGVIAYLFCAAVCLESTWGRRTVLILIGVCSVMICYMQTVPEAYDSAFSILMLFVIVLAALPLGSILRFKEGHQ